MQVNHLEVLASFSSEFISGAGYYLDLHCSEKKKKKKNPKESERCSTEVEEEGKPRADRPILQKFAQINYF